MLINEESKLKMENTNLKTEEINKEKEIKYSSHLNCNYKDDTVQMSIPVCEIRIPVKTNITLAGKVYGNLPSSNPKYRIIALHGWLDNCELFSDIAPRIVANFLKNNDTVSLIAFDSAGHGLSDHRSEEYGDIYYLWDYIADFISALEILDWKNCCIIGHSYGGILSYAMAASYPTKFTGLLVYENLGFMNFQTPDLQPMLLAEYVRVKTNAAKKASKRTNKIFPTFDSACQNRSKGRYDTSLGASKKLLRRGLKRVRANPENNTPAGYIYTYDMRVTYSNFIAPITWNLDQVKAFFEKIKCPTHVILATDGLYPEGDTEGRLKFITHAKRFNFDIVKGPHHFILEEDSLDEATRLTNDFFNQWKLDQH